MENCTPLLRTECQRFDDNHISFSREETHDNSALSHYNWSSYSSTLRNHYLLDRPNMNASLFRNSGDDYVRRDSAINGIVHCKFKYLNDFNEPHKDHVWIGNEPTLKKYQNVISDGLNNPRSIFTSNLPDTMRYELGSFCKIESKVNNQVYSSHFNTRHQEMPIFNDKYQPSEFITNYRSPYLRNDRVFGSNTLGTPKTHPKLSIGDADFKNESFSENIEVETFKEVDNLGRRYLNVPKLLNQLQNNEMKRKSSRKLSSIGTKEVHPYFMDDAVSKYPLQQPIFLQQSFDVVHNVPNKSKKREIKVKEEENEDASKKIQVPSHVIAPPATKSVENQVIDNRENLECKTKERTKSSKNTNKTRNKVKQSQRKYLLDKYLDCVQETEKCVTPCEIDTGFKHFDENIEKPGDICDVDVNNHDIKRDHESRCFQSKRVLSQNRSSLNVEKVNGTVVLKSNPSSEQNREKSNRDNGKMNDLKLAPKTETLKRNPDFRENLNSKLMKPSLVASLCNTSLNENTVKIDKTFFEHPLHEAEVLENPYAKRPRNESAPEITHVDESNKTVINNSTRRDTLESLDSSLFRKSTESLYTGNINKINSRIIHELQTSSEVRTLENAADISTVKNMHTIETQTEMYDGTTNSRVIDVDANTETTISGFELNEANSLSKIVIDKVRNKRDSQSLMKEKEENETSIGATKRLSNKVKRSLQLNTSRFQEANIVSHLNEKCQFCANLAYKNCNGPFIKLQLETSKCNENVNLCKENCLPEKLVHSERSYCCRNRSHSSSKCSLRGSRRCLSDTDVGSVSDSHTTSSCERMSKISNNVEISEQRYRSGVRYISSKNVTWIRKKNYEVDEINIALSYTTLGGDSLGDVNTKRWRNNSHIQELLNSHSSVPLFYEMYPVVEEKSTHKSASIVKSRVWEDCHTQYLEDERAKKWYHFCFKP